MKIDTSKLTPVQAQQIEAIASGVSFNLSLHVTRSFTRSPISIRMTATTDTAKHYDPLIEHYTEQLINTTDADERTITQEHLDMLRRRRAGIPEWQCQYEVFSDQYIDLPYNWKKSHRRSLNGLINITLREEYGLTNLRVDYVAYPRSEVTLDDWESVKRWYDRHLELDLIYGSGPLGKIAATVDKVIGEYISTLPFKDRLSLEYHGNRVDGPSYVWRPLAMTVNLIPRRMIQNLSRRLTKTLDKLRQKA